MPVIKSAIKKVRKDKKRALRNKAVLNKLKTTLKKNKNISEVFSMIDRAAKGHVIHKNKAARLKAKTAKKLKSPA